jgi:GT2 family glycosyltransferase
MRPVDPFVRVVVLNFDGGQMTIDCLQSVLASNWPADRLEVVLVDNGSLDDVVERVRAELPQVRVIEPLANTGFAKGCNLGIDAPGSYDLVALVNNDATVDSDWLRPLVDALDADATIAAACPKILFDGRYVETTIEVPDAAIIGSDPRTLGVRLTAARVDGVRADERLAYDEGFFPPEAPSRRHGEEFARWSWRRGRIRVKVGDRVPSTLSLQVVGLAARTLVVGGETHAIGLEPQWIDIPLEGETFDVINNVGSALYPGGFGGDRGFLERDRGQYDERADVFAWCGGAVLLTSAYLADVGGFDERLFLYYEDTDLSWRGRLRGWRYVFVPDSVVRHRHAQSSGAWSPTFRYYTERNRALVLAKNAPAGLAVRAGLGLVERAVSTSVRDIVGRPLTLRMPFRAEAAHRLRVLRGYLGLLPAMLTARWRGGRARSRRSVMAWELPAKQMAA